MSKTIHLCGNGEISREYHYNPNHVLGEGGFGKVFQCTNKDKCTSYALKEIKIYEKDKKEREKAITEIHKEIRNLKIIRNACSQYLLCIVDWGRSCNLERVIGSPLTYYIVMEDLSSWTTLSKFIKSQKAPNNTTLIRIVNEMTAGLLFLHKKFGMAHFDVKPANILVNLEDPNVVRVKYIDFGSAIKECNTENSGEARGTYAYMDLETACLGKMACKKSDYYSLGLVFIYMCTGEEQTFTDTDFFRFCFNIKNDTNQSRDFIQKHSIALQEFLKDADYEYIDILNSDPTKRIIRAKMTPNRSPSMTLSRDNSFDSGKTTLDESTESSVFDFMSPRPPSSSRTQISSRQTQSMNRVPHSPIGPKPNGVSRPGRSYRPNGGSTRKRRRKKKRIFTSRRYYRKK
jgi:serine/threonine protein kinase